MKSKIFPTLFVIFGKVHFVSEFFLKESFSFSLLLFDMNVVPFSNFSVECSIL